MSFGSNTHDRYWQTVWKQFLHHRLGLAALCVIVLFCLAGIYAPFLASSKPLVVYFDEQWYFPLFRYLFYQGFFTKRLDLFYNLLMFTLPLGICIFFIFRHYPRQRLMAILSILLIHLTLFLYLSLRTPKDPASDPALNQQKQELIQSYVQEQKQDPLFSSPLLSNWQTDLKYMNDYAKLNLVLRYQQRKAQHEELKQYESNFLAEMERKGQKEAFMPTLWNIDLSHEQEQEKQLEAIIDQNKEAYPIALAKMNLLKESCQWHQNSDFSTDVPPSIVCDFLQLSAKDWNGFLQAKQIVNTYEKAQAQLQYLQDRRQWLEEQSSQLRYEVMPLIRSFHWEDDAGGGQMLNRYVDWFELTRINRKDMVAALIFGIRISLSVGLTAVVIALLIGIPIGALAGYYGGKIDILTYRLIEIWESMPTFFMLLMIVAFLQTKSVFLVIAVIGLFGWTGFSRFIRGEFFKQKQLPYVEACHALGFNDRYIMFVHLLPNAIPPLLTLVPFAMMGAITSEAALSFLGLGEEGSGSWGVLMDEGRTAFPAESYLLWPPAILLTIFLVAIALVGDALRDALDPKLHS